MTNLLAGYSVSLLLTQLAYVSRYRQRLARCAPNDLDCMAARSVSAWLLLALALAAGVWAFLSMRSQNAKHSRDSKRT